MPSSHLILCRPFFLLPPIPPSIRVFSNESTLCMRWPKYWFSTLDAEVSALASFLPKNTQGWSPLEWTGWIPLQSYKSGVCKLCRAKSLQSCPTLCDPMDCSLPCSSIHGILQARILEWFAISFSKGCFWPRDWSRVSYVFCIGRLVLYHLHNLGMNEWMKVAQLCPTLCSSMDCPWNSPGKNIEVGCHCLLQGIFLTHGLKLGLLHDRQILYHLSYREGWGPNLAHSLLL